MKNEKQFKERISEIASKIAEEMADDEKEMEKAEKSNPNKSASVDVDKFIAKLNTFDQAMTPFYNAINNAQELGLAIEYIVGKMPNIKGNTVSGLRLAIDKISDKMANKNTPAIGKDDPNAMYDEMPLPKGMPAPKNESFARMVKLANLKG